MEFRIAVVGGDGIGPEVTGGAIRALDRIGELYGHSFKYDMILAGGCSIDKIGVPITDKALRACLESDSVLLGAIGGPKWDNLPGLLRAETALFALRKEMAVFANIRPAVLLPVLRGICPLRADIAEKGFDMIIVRELTGGIYFGERGRDGAGAFDTERYSAEEIRRIGKIGFELARKRGKKLTSIDKSNVMESSRLWREVICDLAKDYPDVALNHLLVDNAAMQLVRNPAQFDVIVTSNMFGDILSDEASALVGSIGMLPSAALGEGTRGVYEPIHGTAPDIAGKDIANPIATILSAAMMLRMSFGLEEEARSIEAAVAVVLDAGHRTADIASPGENRVSGSKMTELVVGAIKKAGV